MRLVPLNSTVEIRYSEIEKKVELNSSDTEKIPFEEVLTDKFKSLLQEQDRDKFVYTFYYLAKYHYFDKNMFIASNVGKDILKILKNEALVEKMDGFSIVRIFKPEYVLFRLIDDIISHIMELNGPIIIEEVLLTELDRMNFNEWEQKCILKRLKSRVMDRKRFYLLSKSKRNITMGFLNYYKRKLEGMVKTLEEEIENIEIKNRIFNKEDVKERLYGVLDPLTMFLNHMGE